MKPSSSFTLFDTAIGTCAVAWNPVGIVRFQLPEAEPAATRARVAANAAEGKPPAWVEDVIDRVRRHLAGEVQDLSNVKVDLREVPAFHAKVYEALRAVPAGKTVTYAELARAAGSPGAVRAVGQSMAKNPIPVVIPCHRVLGASDKPGGFSAYGGVETKAKLLAKEGRAILPEPLFAGGAPELPYDRAEAIAHLSAADPALGALIARVGPFTMRLKQTEGAFLALAESIVYQQLHGKAAATILGRVRSLFGGGAFTPQHVLGASDDALRACGLSRAKLAALRDLADKSEKGVVPPLPALEKLTDDEIVDALTSVRGIGRWTVEMLLIFRMGRPDVLPVTDYGVRQGFQLTFKTRGLPDPAKMFKRAEKWRPYRSVASWYMWRAVEVSRVA
jgi:methylated-DNA-[protein]-cysteine S-methyltransferase